MQSYFQSSSIKENKDTLAYVPRGNAADPTQSFVYPLLLNGHLHSFGSSAFHWFPDSCPQKLVPVNQETLELSVNNHKS